MDVYVAREDPEPGVNGAHGRRARAAAAGAGALRAVLVADPGRAGRAGAPRRHGAHPRRRRRDAGRARGAGAARGAARRSDDVDARAADAAAAEEPTGVGGGAGPGDPTGGPDRDAACQPRQRFARRQRARRWLAWRRVLVAARRGRALVGGVWLVFFSSVLAVHASVAGDRCSTEARSRRRGRAARACRWPPSTSTPSRPGSRGWPPVASADVVARLARPRPRRRHRAAGASPSSSGRAPARRRRRRRGVPHLRRAARRTCRWSTCAAATPADALAEAAAVVVALPAELLARVARQVGAIDAIALELARRRPHGHLGQRGRVGRQGRGARRAA